MSVTLQQAALAVKRMQARHHREANQRLAEVGLSLPQWDVLRHLRAGPDASLHDLAVLTFQSDQAMGTLVARMIERGLLERSDGPGRATRHRITAAGERARREGSGLMDTVFTDSLGRLTAAERSTLHRLLLKAGAEEV